MGLEPVDKHLKWDTISQNRLNRERDGRMKACDSCKVNFSRLGSFSSEAEMCRCCVLLTPQWYSVSPVLYQYSTRPHSWRIERWSKHKIPDEAEHTHQLSHRPILSKMRQCRCSCWSQTLYRRCMSASIPVTAAMSWFKSGAFSHTNAYHYMDFKKKISTSQTLINPRLQQTV